MSFKIIRRRFEPDRVEVYPKSYDASNGCEVVVNARGTRKGTAPWRLGGFEVVISDYKAGVSSTWWLDEIGNCSQEPADEGEDTTRSIEAAWDEFSKESPIDDWIYGLIRDECEIQEEEEKERVTAAARG